MRFSARDFLTEVAPAFRDAVNPCEVLKSIHQRAAKGKGHKIIPASAALGALAISGGELEGCLDETATATSLTFQEIPLLLWTPVSDSIMEVLQRFVGRLLGNGRWLQAVAIAYYAWRWDATLASELLGIVEREAGGLDRLDQLARTFYEEADYSARRARAEGLKERAERVEAFLSGLKEDAVGLHARALLGARLADALGRMGVISVHICCASKKPKLHRYCANTLLQLLPNLRGNRGISGSYTGGNQGKTKNAIATTPTL